MVNSVGMGSWERAVAKVDTRLQVGVPGYLQAGDGNIGCWYAKLRIVPQHCISYVE